MSFEGITLLNMLYMFLTVFLSSINLSDCFELTILHTNDVHARVEETNKYGGTCSEADSSAENCYGGVARRYTKIEEIRQSRDNVLLLDAGDQFQGTLWFQYYDGLGVAHFVNKLGYDAMALGNHEFDEGLDSLAKYIRNLTSPVVACNINAVNEPQLNGLLHSSVIFNIGGEKVGIIGYLTAETELMLTEDKTGKIIFNDEIDSIQQEVNTLQNLGVNKIIALGHSGFLKDIEIAEKVNGLDLVIGGHSNTFLYTGDPPSIEVPQGLYPYEVLQADGTKVYVVQDYAFGKYLGYLSVTFNEQGAITNAVGNPILLDYSVEQDPDILHDVQTMSSQLNSLYKEVIGQSYVRLEGNRNTLRLNESNLGNLVTDAMLFSHLLSPGQPEHWSEYSIAFWNAGGIRASIEQGPFTYEDISNVLPFQDEVHGCKILGKHLLEILELSVKNYDVNQPAGNFLHWSGVKVTYDVSKSVGERVLRDRLLIRCSDCVIPKFEPLVEDKIYGVVSTGFLLNGGDGYGVLRDYAFHRIEYGSISTEVLKDYLKQHAPITAGLEGRIRFYDKNQSKCSCKVKCNKD